jgi:four helix bundle protein
MSEIQNYRDLEAWQIGMDVVLRAYDVTNQFPRDERFGLTAQMRRAAVSVPSNIAEDQVWNAPGVFLRHIRIALGSLAELDTQLEAAIRLAYVSAQAVVDLQNTMQSSRRLLYGLRRAQRKRLGFFGCNYVDSDRAGGPADRLTQRDGWRTVTEDADGRGRTGDEHGTGSDHQPISVRPPSVLRPPSSVLRPQQPLQNSLAPHVQSA